ncbi:MAG: hypothetical protein OXG68_00860 [Chloroflexi bacterium]|nr:hypothetical protein [Chloroflexota bacterium]
MNWDWGDTWGWRRCLPVSYLGFAYGAALSWAYAENRELNLPLALDSFVFEDRKGLMGQLVYDLGNAYQETDVIQNVASLLYSLHIYSLDNLRERASLLFHAGESQKTLFDDDLLRARLHASLEYIADCISPIEQARLGVSDAELIKREFKHMALLAQHGARRGLLQMSDPAGTRQSMRDELALIEAEFPLLWLARSRPGGMVDSQRQLAEMRLHYESAES